MSAFQDRPRTALLVIDLQNLVVDGAFRRDEVVGAVKGLVDRAHAQDVPVVWVQHEAEHLPPDTHDWEFVPELRRRDGDRLVPKTYGDAFEGTILEEVLADLGVGHLVVTGAETDACIRSTIHGGFARGYDVTLVADAHTAGDKTRWGAPPVEQVIDHTNLYWQFQEGVGKTAAVVSADEVSFPAP
ncbi:isochorismatase family protein [Corynebacterium sp.]|jgi:nicotinamidase-related amidase|uniref:isochorismatase family protein n=1 Tax=Corynebacterium sp. TaxID=1720 RepID=UPI0025C6ACEA|nr:isochorismatase family protein [Corynebacterium sp.]